MVEQGFRVRALARNPRQCQDLEAQGISVIQGDLHNPSALRQLVAGCDAVIHGAGAVRGSSQQAFDEVNVAGTAALLSAIKSQPGHPRLLLLSSLAAREPDLSWYAHSKREGEELVRREVDMDWVVIRPPAVYGPGDREMLPVFQWMARGIAFVPGCVESRTSLIHVSDLVAAIIACVDTGRARHQTLSLCDGRPGGYNWRELADIAATTWTRQVRLWRVPPWLLNSVARCNLMLADITGRAPMLTPPKLRELRHSDWVVDNEAITTLTGWKPLISLREGLQEIGKAAI